MIITIWDSLAVLCTSIVIPVSRPAASYYPISVANVNKLFMQAVKKAKYYTKLKKEKKCGRQSTEAERSSSIDNDNNCFI
jgi:hypothetical protein